MNVLADVYEFSMCATASSLREVMAHDRAHVTPLADIALRAVASAFDSDVQGAISLLRYGVVNAPATDGESAYLRDLLIMHLTSTGAFDEAERVFRECAALPPRLAPAFSSLHSVLKAVTGDVAASRNLARNAIASARQLDAPLVLGRVLSRCALAGYYRGDYDDAREIALEGVHLFESRGAFASACTVYSVAAAVAQDWNRDSTLAAAHYSRMIEHAERSGHNAMRRSALAGAFLVAAEAYDRKAYADFRKRLVARPEREQHQENYCLLLANVLGLGWDGKFQAAEAALTAYAATSDNTAPQAALVEALLALTAAAGWDVELARARSRSALRRTAGYQKHEPLYDQRYREIARVLAAATCFIIGDTIRGQRALSGRFDAGQRYVTLLTAPSIDLDQCSEVFRGYAKFIEGSAAAANAARPRYRLTPAELQVLRALPHGSTIAALAVDLKKSKSTIARQVESIYGKLGARNRAHAVQIARELGVT